MKALDFYGNTLRITLNKKPHIKSNLGGFFSIITVFVVLVSGYFIGQDIITKSSPWFSVEFDIGNKVNPITINGDNELPIAIEVQKKLGFNYRDESVLKYNLYLVEWIYDPFGTSILEVNQNNLKLKNCTYSDWKHKINESKYQNWGLDNKLCFDYKNITLKGSINEDYFKFLKFEVSRCTNLTNNKCKSNKEIDNLIINEELTLNIFFSYSGIDITNNKQPTLNVINSKSKFLVNGKHKQILVELEPVTIYTDNGVLFPDTVGQDFFNLNFNEQDMKDMSENNPVLFSYMIGSSNLKVVYNRSYIKVTDVFAKLGGIIKLLTLIFSMIIYSIDFVEKTRSTINEIFILKDLEKENNQENYSEIGSRKGKVLTCNSNSKSIEKRNFNEVKSNFDFYRRRQTIIINKNFRSKFIEDLKSEDNIKLNFQKTLEKIIDRKKSDILTLSLRDTFNIIFYNKNRNYGTSFQKKLFFFRKCSEKISECLDIKTFFQKFEEIIVLKKILLNQNELSMLDQLIKPCLKYKLEAPNVNECLNEENILRNFIDNIQGQNYLIDKNILNLI